MASRVFGRELRTGDVVEVWWAPGRDTVIRFVPYQGPLAYLWPKGVRIIEFALLKNGMTAGNDDVFTRIEPERA